MEIIAHRGSSFLAPENTLAAAHLAWQEGADAVEGDFRLTADGHIVCIHDDSLKRTAGIDRPVAEMTLRDLQAYDIGIWKGFAFDRQRVPTLDQLFAAVPAGKRLYAEVKCGLEIIEPLSRAISGYGPAAAEQIILICLQLPVIAEIKRVIPQCPAYWVVARRTDSPDWIRPADEIVPAALEANLDGLDLAADGPIDATLVQDAKTAGLRLCTWTVDDPSVARRLIELGIDGITTNRPGWLREKLS